MSEASRSMALPASIVVGAGIVALGLYLGVRERGGPAPSAPTAPSTASAAPTPGPVPVPARVPTAAQVSTSAALPPSVFEVRAAATKEVDGWIGARKKALAAKCWPSNAGASQKIRIRFLFDATGRASAVIAEQTAESRKDVIACLERELADAKVTALPEPLGVQVELTLP